MVIEQQKRAPRGWGFTLSVACLSAFFAFGNVVSAFGKTPAANKPRRKSASVKTTAKSSKPAASAETAPAAEPASNEPASKRQVFQKVGEPFLVSTAGAPPQTQTTPSTPGQRDARRPPGTQERTTVPPGANPAPGDPRVPPGTERVPPTAPPGTQVEPQRTTPDPQRTTIDPNRPTPTDIPPAVQPTTPAEPGDVPDPTFPVVQPRPVPPVPSLQRVGVNGEPLSLSLNDAIRRALENNNEIEVARADVRIAESQLTALRGVFDPVITYTPEYNKAISPVTNIFGGAGSTGTVSTTDLNNDVSINKQFGKGGGNYSYFFNNTRRNTSASNSTLNPQWSATQGIQFTQPLWRNRSIDNNRRQIRIQQKRLEQSDADFRQRTIDIISQVQRAYWNLAFALRDEQNQLANLNLTRENFRQTEARVAAGAVAPLERAEVQTELSNREAALLAATQQVTFAENTLKNLLIKDPLSPDWSKVLVPTDQPTVQQAADTPVNLDEALKEARTGRQELRRLRLQSDINGIDLTYFENQTKPRIDLTGSFTTNGTAGQPGLTEVPDPNFPDDPTRTITQPIPVCAPNVVGRCIPSNFIGSYGQTLRNLFSFDTRQIIVGVTIQLPLRNRTAEANLATAQIQRDQLAASMRSQEQAVEVEVRNAVQSVETARLRVLAARTARESAEEQLAGERRLYQVGRSTTFLLFQRENALVNARNQELRAETDYSIALSELQRATSTTLRLNNVVIDNPTLNERFKD
jgi:outer membrane protein